MKRLALAMIALLAFAASACGKDTHVSIFLEQKALARQLGDTLEKITDAASAKAHKATLQSLEPKFQSLKARSEKLPKPTEEETKTIMAKITGDKELLEIAMKVQGSLMRIQQDPAISAELKDINFATLMR